MEGVERYKVRLLPHNTAWEEEFLRVKEELLVCWGDNIDDVQHVGSTAVRGICAKPILDVAVRLKSIGRMDVGRLAALGYDYCGPQHGNEKYHLFVLRGENQLSLRHIHCYDYEEEEFWLQTGFRDYLNSHKDEAAGYESLKMALAEKYPDDRAAYTAGKEEFIRRVNDRVSGESGKEGEHGLA